MPVTLAELGGMKNTHSKQQPKKKFTVIEDILSTPQGQQIQQEGRDKFYHNLDLNDQRQIFNKQIDYPNWPDNPGYSSDWTIPAMHSNFPDVPAKRYIRAAREIAGPQATAVYDVQGNIIDLPRTVAPIETVKQIESGIQQYSSFNTNPPYAGAVPMMKNAAANDTSVTVEGFGYQHTSGCMDILNHIHTCEACKSYFRCNNSPYLVTIFAFAILLLIVLFFLFKRRRYEY
jgi:hypothetical protein